MYYEEYPKELLEAFKNEAFNEETEEVLSFSQWLAQRLLAGLGEEGMK